MAFCLKISSYYANRFGQNYLYEMIIILPNANMLIRICTEIITIGRIYLPDQPTNMDPIDAVNDWWSKVKNTIMQYSSVDYWEGNLFPPILFYNTIRYDNNIILYFRIQRTRQIKFSYSFFLGLLTLLL